MPDLPDKLYSVDSVVQLEQIAINQYGIAAYELMKRAGAVVFDVIRNRYTNKKILVLCGAGNNAGDGYVVAKLAKQTGYEVRVVSLIDPLTLKNEALLAYKDWLSVAENDVADISLIEKSEVIVDALLGTGLKRQVSAGWCEWINAVNHSVMPVIAVDIPTGLFADTGAIAGHSTGVAIKADITVSFIGLKQGMFTAQANDVCGEVIFSDLGLPDEAYSQVKCTALLVKRADNALLVKRKSSSHKGCFGHVLIAGGNDGMPGAVILAARAALRAGAGLVTIITIPQHLPVISAAVPEAMIKTCITDAGKALTENIPSVDGLFQQPFINEISHVAVGMGLGQDDWSLDVLQHCVKLDKPILIDADALNLMAKHESIISELSIAAPLIITPHPGEAARLLSSGSDVNTADIQGDRFAAVKKLHNLFHHKICCTAVLKGSGTLVYDGEIINVCNLGNAAMAAPGMGDVLSGIIIGLLAQNLDKAEAGVSETVTLAVCLHASAAELMVGDKTRGLLASDVIDYLPKVLQ